MYSQVASGSPLQPLGSTKAIVYRRDPPAQGDLSGTRGSWPAPVAAAHPSEEGTHRAGMGSPTAVEYSFPLAVNDVARGTIAPLVATATAAPSPARRVAPERRRAVVPGGTRTSIGAEAT